LLVTRRGTAAESRSWLRAVARALRPRIPLGERLLVAAPAFRELRVAAQITAAVGARPERVHRAVCDDLARRLAGETWALGRNVSTTAVAGWIRLVAGVERVSDVTFLGKDKRPLGEMLELRADELPRLATDRVTTDIVVEAGARP
jgi:DNA-binding PucR family transcriptional regulator